MRLKLFILQHVVLEKRKSIHFQYERVLANFSSPRKGTDQCTAGTPVEEVVVSSWCRWVP